MDYMQLFRGLREAKGLTIDGLATLAGCHRNTVTNVESGRPVKFRTIAALMEKMGYPRKSHELSSVALLWMEAVSGVPFSQPQTEAAAVKTVSGYRTRLREAAQRLEAEVIQQNLAPRQIDLLLYAVRHPEVLTILENVRDLVASLGTDADTPDIKAAEESD